MATQSKPIIYIVEHSNALYSANYPINRKDIMNHHNLYETLHKVKFGSTMEEILAKEEYLEYLQSDSRFQFDYKKLA